MEIFWWLLLGALLAGYFALGGYDYGTQVLTPVVGRRDRGRRGVLAAVGPFVLGNEVWLVAVVGVLFGAFPLFEGVLLVGLFPLVVPLVLALVVGNAAIQLRSRFDAARSRRVADVLVVLGGAVPALLWGMILAVLLRGVRRGPEGYFFLGLADVAHPFVLVSGVATTTLFLAHGACFLALRSGGEVGERAGRIARTAAPTAATALLVTAGVGALSDLAAPGAPGALAVVGVAVLALAAAGPAGRTGRRGLAFAATTVAAVAPVVALGAGLFPFLLVTTGGEPLTIAAGAASPTTLGLLTGVAAVAVPAVVALQLWSWWAMRGRVDELTPSYH